MKYKPEWHDAMAFIADARKSGWTDGQMSSICRLAREKPPVYKALVRAYDEDPEGFVAALEGMAESGPKAIAEQEKRFKDAAKSLDKAYHKLARKAFALPTGAKVKKAERRVHHRASWLKTPGLAPRCQNGHVMDFAVLITAKELDLCLPWEKHRSGAVFFACTESDCLHEEDNGRLVIDPSVYNRALAASDCEPTSLATFDDLPRSNEPTLWPAMRPQLPDLDELEVDQILQDVIDKNTGPQRSKIGGYCAYWNPKTCEKCESKKRGFSNVVELAALPDVLGDFDHWVVSACHACHHVQCSIEGS